MRVLAKFTCSKTPEILKVNFKDFYKFSKVFSSSQQDGQTFSWVLGRMGIWLYTGDCGRAVFMENGFDDLVVETPIGITDS